MTGIGCHERDNRADYNVSYGQYLNRFSGLQSLVTHSGSPSLHYYSWTMGHIHFISIDTDPWIYTTRYANMYQRLQEQYEWLLADLERVDRSITPWLIVLGHRGMYCQKKSEDAECNQEAEMLRLGITDPVSGHTNQFPLEELWQKYAVDLYFAGHTHHYERSWPVRNNGSVVQKSYVNAEGTVYILSGIGGVEGDPDALPDEQHRREWNSYMDTQYRRMFGLLTVYNATTLQYDAVDSDNNVFDTFVLQKPL